MLVNQSFDLSQLRSSEVAAAFQTQRIEPKLRHFSVPRDVDMGWFASVTCVKEEPIRTSLQYRRHASMLPLSVTKHRALREQPQPVARQLVEVAVRGPQLGVVGDGGGGDDRVAGAEAGIAG